MMHMTLYWSKEVTLLFDDWNTDSWFGYILTLLFCFFLSLFYQHLEARRLNFKLKSHHHLQMIAPLIPPPPPPPKWVPTPWVRFASSLLFGVNSAIGYLIMLAIMSYNGGVFVAVVVGLSVGHFMFCSGNFGDSDHPVMAVDSYACACS